MQIKRIHEYKRQLLNALALIKRYGELKRATPEERKNFVRKTVFFAGKAAPGYFNAKCIIRLICGISEVVNSDPETNHYLKVTAAIAVASAANRIDKVCPSFRFFLCRTTMSLWLKR